MPVIERLQQEQDHNPATTKVAVNMREDDDGDLRSMIEDFGADKGYEVRVYRTSPKKWGSPPVSIEGHVGTFDEWLNEEELKALFGGGTLQLKVYRPNSKGSMQYFKAVSIKLPGKPKGEGIDEEPDVSAAPQMIDYGQPEDSVLAQQAMSTMKELIDKKQESSAFDPTMMQMLMAPMQAQVAASNAAIAQMQADAREKDKQLLELIGAKPDTSEKDGLLNKMFDTESSRSEHLRNMHESEMRQLRESHKEDAKRADDRHRDEQRRAEDMQRREVDNLTRSNDTMMATLKMSYDSRIEGYKKDIERLERDMGKTDTELVMLRAKKDKTIIEQVSEIQTIKEAFTSIGGGKEEDSDDRKWYEKILGQVVENPEGVAHVVGQFTGAGNPQLQQQAAQQQFAEPEHQQLAAPQPGAQEEQVLDIEQIPRGVPFRAPDGELYVKVGPDDSVVTYEQALKLAKDIDSKENPTLEPPSPAEVKAAIGFVESAFQAGTEPGVLANSAKAMVPANILKYIESVGVDTFLNEVAVLEQGSPLRNQAGRTYIREVMKFLLEGVTS